MGDNYYICTQIGQEIQYEEVVRSMRFEEYEVYD